jgi:tRNA(Ile)-lysidine synthase
MAKLPKLEIRLGQWLQRLEGSTAGLAVAISGGPDSVALTLAAAAARGPNAASPLVLAHLNHQLRGNASDEDEEFVAALHRQLQAAGVSGLRLRIERLAIATLARCEGENLEAVARRERYRWLATIAKQEGVCWVATGHTADDQAETVLHRLVRGTGLQGLRGIASRRPLEAGISLVRPLLQTTRAEVLEYLQERGQSFREDQSNHDPRYTRNRIRAQLLPLLTRDYNPAVVATLGRLAAQAEEAFALQEELATELLNAAQKPRAGELCVLDRTRLCESPRLLTREALRQLWATQRWPLGEMGFDAWDRLLKVVWGEAAAVDLPGGIRAWTRPHVVLIGRVQ